MRLLALVAIAAFVFMAAPVSAHSGPACMGCDAIIEFCEKHFHTQCVAATGPETKTTAPTLQCALSLCQDIDRICARWGAHCVA
jgi:hypothetical protein